MPLRAVAIATALVAVACQGCALPSLPTGVAGMERLPRADTTELRQRVDALVAGFPGKSAVWISDAGDPWPLYARDEDEEVLAASLWKLAALVHVERLVERGELRYDDTLTVRAEDITVDGSYVLPGGEVTVDEALELMIARSDNGTALALLRIHGGEAMNASLGRERIEGVHVQRDGDDENLVTARGIGTLLQRLAERKLVSAAASDRMVARLERQVVTGRSDAYLPEGTRVAHKTGDIVGAAHDAAIVWTKIGPRIVVVLTWEAGQDESHELIARVTEAAFETAK